MTELQIQILLDEIKDEPFLQKVVKIKENDKRYRESEYFKTTKISLAELYKNYEIYYQTRYGQGEAIAEAIHNIDIEIITDKVLEALVNLETKQPIQEMIQKVLDIFDLKEIQKNSEELKKEIQDLKK